MARPSPEVRTTTFMRGRDFGSGYNEAVASYESYRRTYIGHLTPNFRKLKPGQLPVNDFSMTVTRTTEGSAMDQLIDSQPFPNNIYNLSIDATGLLFPYTAAGVPVLSHLPRAFDQACEHLAEHAEADLKANLAQDIAQCGQVVDLIANTAIRLSGAIHAVKRGNLGQAAKSLATPLPRRGRAAPKPGHSSFPGIVANNWLELQYGWKPLLMDIDGAMRSLANSMVKTRAIRSVQGKGSQASSDRGSYPNTYNGGGAPVGQWSWQASTRCKIGLRYQINNAVLAFLGQTGFTNPINLLWEILPYSFVVDWFLPIGPYLESMSAFAGMTFIDGYVSNTSRLDYSAAVGFGGRGANESNTVERTLRGSRQVEVVKFDRAKLTTFPRKPLPELKSPISTGHALNALALMVQAFKL